jgi:hypothetical protein
MTGQEMVKEIVSCFVPPQHKMIEKMEYIADSIPESARKEIIDAITETEGPATKIGASHIVEACNRLGVSYHRSTYTPAEPWTCDACGFEFKYTLAPSDDDKIDKGLYDACPMCGMQPGWTQLANRYNALGIATPWLDRLINECAISFGPKIEAHQVKKGAMNLFRGGIYWARARAESERKEAKKIEIDAKMDALGKSKRWDLKTDSDLL